MALPKSLSINLQEDKQVKSINIIGDSLSGYRQALETSVSNLHLKSLGDYAGLPERTVLGGWSDAYPWNTYLCHEIVNQDLNTIEGIMLKRKSELDDDNVTSDGHKSKKLALINLILQRLQREKHHIAFELYGKARGSDLDEKIISNLDNMKSNDHLGEHDFKTYDPNHPRDVTCLGRLIMRRDAEGGAYAGDYSYIKPTHLPPHLQIKDVGKEAKRAFKYQASRLILSTLRDLYNRYYNYLFKNTCGDAKAIKASNKRKVTIQWIGANDFMTVNDRPDARIIKKTIAARINNIKKMIKLGHDKFIIMNMPKLAAAPYFTKNKDKFKRMDADCQTFNKKLAAEIELLREQHKNIKIEIFDAYKEMETILDDYEDDHQDKQGNKYNKYGLNNDPKIRYEPYCETAAFKKYQSAVKGGYDGTTPAHLNGRAFNDLVHPTSIIHKLIGQKMLCYLKKFGLHSFVEIDKNIKEPEIVVAKMMAKQSILARYNQQLDHDRYKAFTGWASVSNYNRDIDLVKFFRETLFDRGYITNTAGRRLKVLLELGIIKPTCGNYELNTEYEFYDAIRHDYNKAREMSYRPNAWLFSSKAIAVQAPIKQYYTSANEATVVSPHKPDDGQMPLSLKQKI